MKYAKTFVLCLVGIGFSNALFAQEKRNARREYSAPYGIAGCGLGSVIITKKDKSSQQIASVINSLIGFVSSAITSGTSNCHAGSQTAQLEQRVYISANLRSLEKEAALGDGTHLSALAELFGCRDQNDIEKFSGLNKNHFQTIYGSDDPDAIFAKLKEVGREDRNVASSCPGLV